MSLQLYQVVILALAAYMIYQGGAKFLKQESGQTALKFAVRVIVWGGMAAITTFPNLSNQVATTIGIEGNINAVILVGFVLVFVILFKLLGIIEQLEREVSEVIRKETLSETYQSRKNQS